MNHHDDQVVDGRTMIIDILRGHVFVGVEKVNQDCKQRHLAGTIYKKDGEKEVVTKMGCPVCK